MASISSRNNGLARFALTVAVLAALAGGARAQGGGDLEKARIEKEEGVAAYKLGNFDDAAKHFENAYRITKLPNMLFDVAQAYRRAAETKKNLDYLAKAIELYKAYLRDPGATSTEKRAIAADWVPKLERQHKEESERRRAEMLSKATGREGIFLADQLLGDGVYKEAQQILDRVLGSRNNPRDVIVSGLEKRALVAAKLKQDKVAVEAYKRLLVLDPGFLVPDGDAAMTAAYQSAKKQLAGTKPLTASHIPPGELRKDVPNVMAVNVESDPLAMVVDIALHYRVAGGGAFSTTRAPKNKGGVELPRAFASGVRGNSKIEYYLVLLDEADGEVALLGSQKEPFAVTVLPTAQELASGIVAGPPKKPLHKRGWFWGTVVGVAAVVGVGLGVGLGLGLVNNPDEIKLP